MFPSGCRTAAPLHIPDIVFTKLLKGLHMKIRNRLMTGVAVTATTWIAGIAHSAPADINATTGTEGADVQEVVVAAESTATAAAAPSKASLLETQPQSIITQQFIEQSTPESGDYTTAILIAPSVSGISSNGGGVGDTNTITLRGFQDGQFNITYDGIAFGDANDLTHHPMAFFPGSTIGAAVVDRGPGVAGDLGMANFGGSVHLFSPNVTDAATARQKITYGSFNTQSYVTTLQSGTIGWLNGTKVMLNLDERTSDGELSYSGGKAFNQMLKFVAPLANGLLLTGYSSFNYIRYNQSDNGAALGAGVTADQLAQYGKNFALNSNPNDEHYYKYNIIGKHTNFNYLDLRWDAGKGLSVEDQLYDYNYNNNTLSAKNVNDLISITPGPAVSPSSAVVDGAQPTDIAGYNKLNRYHTYGNILRTNQDFGFGTLRTGGIVEWSQELRYHLNYDLNTGLPDYGSPGPNTNIIAYEPTRWVQYQLFADFAYRPIEQLTITPGVKYLHFARTVDAVEFTKGTGTYLSSGTDTYTKPVYFLTANYRITNDWSVYAQGASAFLVPPVKTLETAHGTTTSTQPETTDNYQVGTVYTAGPVDIDFDYYHIKASNVLVNYSSTACLCYRNLGAGTYSGVEAQGAYAIGHGLTAFVNGSINRARNTNPGDGSPPTDFSNAPRGTAAYGLIFETGQWMASASAKWVGPQIGSDGATPVSAYTTVDGSVAYDFGNIKLKLAGFNLGNSRSLIDFDGTYYVFQVGRQIQMTFEAKL
jgi:iron complex outermembrane recepter protein